jgi:hypothetical protein
MQRSRVQCSNVPQMLVMWINTSTIIVFVSGVAATVIYEIGSAAQYTLQDTLLHNTHYRTHCCTIHTAAHCAVQCSAQYTLQDTLLHNTHCRTHCCTLCSAVQCTIPTTGHTAAQYTLQYTHMTHYRTCTDHTEHFIHHTVLDGRVATLRSHLVPAEGRWPPATMYGWWPSAT